MNDSFGSAAYTFFIVAVLLFNVSMLLLTVGPVLTKGLFIAISSL